MSETFSLPERCRKYFGTSCYGPLVPIRNKIFVFPGYNLRTKYEQIFHLSLILQNVFQVIIVRFPRFYFNFFFFSNSYFTDSNRYHVNKESKNIDVRELQ